MKKGPPERTVLDGTGCGGAVPSSRGQEGKPAACCRPEKHGRSIARWPGKAMPRPRSVQFDTQSRRARRDADGRAPAPEGQEAFRWCACGRQGPGRLPPRAPVHLPVPRQHPPCRGRRSWLYRSTRLGCHRGPAAGAAGGGDIGDLQPLENPVGKCSLRDVLAKGAPLRSGECWPAIRRSRKRWHWDKPGRDRGGAWQDAGMPFGKRKGRFPQREPAFQILVGPPGLEPGTCRL